MNRRSLLLGSLSLVAVGAEAKKKKHRKPRESARSLLSWVASMQTHGFSDEGPSPEELVAMISRGQHIEVSCGYVAAMGVLVMQQHGCEARVVGCLTHDPWDGHNDGHIMLELREGQGWTLFDLDFNRALPQGVGIADACNGQRKWDVIAKDPLCTTWCEGGTTQKAVASGDAHLFGTAWIEDAAGWKVFHDDERRAFYEGKGFRWVDAEAWDALVH